MAIKMYPWNLNNDLSRSRGEAEKTTATTAQARKNRAIRAALKMTKMTRTSLLAHQMALTSTASQRTTTGNRQTSRRQMSRQTWALRSWRQSKYSEPPTARCSACSRLKRPNRASDRNAGDDPSPWLTALRPGCWPSHWGKVVTFRNRWRLVADLVDLKTNLARFRRTKVWPRQKRVDWEAWRRTQFGKTVVYRPSVWFRRERLRLVFPEAWMDMRTVCKRNWNRARFGSCQTSRNCFSTRSALPMSPQMPSRSQFAKARHKTDSSGIKTRQVEAQTSTTVFPVRNCVRFAYLLTVSEMQRSCQ